MFLHSKGKADRKCERSNSTLPGEGRRLVLTENSVDEHLGEIAEFVNKRLVARHGKSATLVSPARTRKRRTGVKVITFDPPCARTILGWRRTYIAADCNPLVLRDRLENCGNWSMKVANEVAEIMAVEVPKYAAPERPMPSTIQKNINDKINALNATRSEDLPHVSAKTVCRAIDRLDKYQTMYRREGAEFTRRYLAFVASDYRNDHVGHRVQIDEWQVDVYTLAVQSGIWECLTPAERARVKAVRRWLWIAIDTASRMVLGLVLSPTQSVDGAMQVLEQVCSDKTHFARAVEATSPWHHAVSPKAIETDWGAGYIKGRFRRAVADLGAIKLYPEAGNPGARGFIESMVGTAAIMIPERMPLGKAFRNPVERRDYPAMEFAGYTDDELAFGILRIIIDGYHASPHSDLDGATPLDEWDRLVALHGAPPPPDRQTLRSLFGQSHERIMSNMGIRFAGNYYTSTLLARHFNQARSNIRSHDSGKFRKVQIRVDQMNLGAISVDIAGKFYPLICVDRDMEGRNLADWVATVSEINRHNAKKAQLRRNGIRKAYEAIESLTLGAQGRSTIAPIVLTVAEIDRAEEQLFATYEMAEDDAPLTMGIFNRPIVPGEAALALQAAMINREQRMVQDAKRAAAGHGLDGRGNDDDKWN